MTAPPRVGLLGYFGIGNLGNDASLEAALDWARPWLPESNIVCLCSEPERVVRRWGVTARPMDGGSTGQRLPRRLRRLRDPWVAWREARRLDAVVIPGMGVLEEQLGVRPWGLPATLFMWALACRLAHKPLVLVAVGAEHVSSRLTRSLFAWTVRQSSVTSVRDWFSATSLAGWGLTEPVDVVPDLVMRLPAQRDVESAAGGRVVVGVMAWYGPHDSRATGQRDHERYLERMSDLVEGLLARGHHVVLVVGDGVDAEAGCEVRRRVVQRVSDGEAADGEIAVAIDIAETPSQRELEAIVAGAQLVVASRYHTLVAAVRCAVPVVSVGYGGKNADLLDDLGLVRYARHIDDWDGEWALDAAADALADQARIRALLAEYTRDARRQVDRHLEALRRRLVEGQPTGRKTGLTGRLNRMPAMPFSRALR